MRTFLTIRPVPTLRRLQRLALAGLGLLALTACQSLTPQLEAALRTPELPGAALAGYLRPEIRIKGGSAVYKIGRISVVKVN